MESMTIHGTMVNVGNMVEFRYQSSPDKPIGTVTGNVEKLGVSTDRHSAQAAFIMVETPKGFRNYTVDKIVGGISVVA